MRKKRISLNIIHFSAHKLVFINARNLSVLEHTVTWSDTIQHQDPHVKLPIIYFSSWSPALESR